MAQEMERSGIGPDAAVLAAVEANALSQLDALRVGRQALEAHELRLLAALGHLAVERAGGPSSERLAMEIRAIAAEVGVRSQVSDRTVEHRIAEAMVLVDTWPAAVEAFAAGRIGRGHMRVVADAGSVLATSTVSAEQRAAFEADMLAVAEATTPARLAKVARRAADAHLAEPLVVRHRAARQERRVRVAEVDDGMAWLSTLMPTVLARGAEHRLRAGARAKAKDDPRTIDQWMADACCDLLLAGGGAPTDGDSSLLSTIAPVVQITIPATTITGAAEQPGVLDGCSPVDAETARALAGGASTWQRLLVDPVTATVAEVDTYAPTSAQRRLLLARDQHCRFPGCAGIARFDDVDHTLAWEHGGRTSLDNLAHLCRRHHTLKHATAWTVEQPIAGELHWTDPLGATYVDRPPPTGPIFTAVEPEPASPPPPGEEGAWWDARRAAADVPGDGASGDPPF